jgi:hypothetical protein
VIITEGEFDAMLLHQEAGDLVDVVTMGSATSHPTDEMLQCLLPATEWLIAYDVDDAGEQGARWWAEHSPRARRVYLPKISENVKDITDYHLAGGDLREWVKFQIGEEESQADESPAPASPTPADRAQWDATLAATITAARAERDAALKRWGEFGDSLEQLQAMGAMNTPEFDALLIEWENLNEAYERAEDRLECAVLTERIRDEAK